MKTELTLLRCLGLLMLVPGVAVSVLGVALGFQSSGVMWLMTAVLLVLGGALVVIPFRFFKKPSVGAANDILTLLSLSVFGIVFSSLKKISPDAWGIPKQLGIAPENAELVRAFLALLVAWLVFRMMRTLVDRAFTQGAQSEIAKV
ncbi:MAG: hypothetical protein QM790_03860 [Nibricoccus sp.]